MGVDSAHPCYPAFILLIILQDSSLRKQTGLAKSVTVIGWTCTQAHDPGRCNPRSLLGIRIMKGGTRAEGGRTDAAAAHLSSSALNRLSVSSCSLEPWSCPGCCPLQGFCCSLDSMSFTKSTEIQNVFNGLFGVG